MTSRHAVTATLVGALSAAGPSGSNAVSRDEIGGTGLRSRLESRMAPWRLAPGEALVATGDGRHLGAPVRVRTVAGSDGRLRRVLEGELPRVLLFDGRSGTATDLHGMPYPLEMSDLDAEVVTTLVWTGEWLDPGSGVGIHVHPADPEHLVRLSYRDTPFEADLRLDPVTLRPLSMERRGFEGLTVTTFGDVRDVDGIGVAHEITREIVVGDVRIEDEFVRYERIAREAIGDDAFSMPATPDAAYGSFDAARSPEVPIRFADTGHLLVDVEIDGRTVGPFILDTGAGATGISPETAEALGLEVVGVSPITSMFGLARASLHRARSLAVGPLTIPEPIFFAMDLSPLSSVFGVELCGIVGFDILLRSRATLDLRAERLTLVDPRSAPGADTPWRELHVHGRTPVVPARIGESELLFRLDAGASGDPVGNVMFNVDAAETMGLAEREDTDTVSFEVMKLGQTRIPHVELAGHTFEDVDVFFAQPGCEAIVNDPYLAGNIGVELLRPFRIVFDYTSRRIAFIQSGG